MSKSDYELMQEAMQQELSGEETNLAEPGTNPDIEVEEAAEEAVEPSTESVNETAAEPESDQDSPTEPEAEPEEETSFGGYKKSEIDAAFKKLDRLQRALDSTNGTYGNKLQKQQEIIESLQQQLAKASAPKKGHGLRASKFENLAKEFPELAELLIADLQEEAGPEADDEPEDKPEAQAAPDIEKRLSKFEEELLLKQAIAELSKSHPDWKDTAGFEVSDTGVIQWNDMRFGNWVATLPPDAQKEVVNTADASVISSYLTDFKQTVAGKKAPVATKNKLDGTVLPVNKTNSSSKRALSEEDEMMEAFRKEMMAID